MYLESCRCINSILSLLIKFGLSLVVRAHLVGRRSPVVRAPQRVRVSQSEGFGRLKSFGVLKKFSGALSNLKRKCQICCELDKFFMQLDKICLCDWFVSWLKFVFEMNICFWKNFVFMNEFCEQRMHFCELTNCFYFLCLRTASSFCVY